MPDYEPLDYRLRCHSKRTDLPPDVLRDICEAYVRLLNLEEERDKNKKLKAERDEARREVCNLMHKTGFLNGDYADSRGWDCFKDAPVVKTLNGVVVSKAKAVPPKFELGEDDK